MVTNATGQQLPVVTAFVSYSHVDRKFGQQAKDVLGEVGIDAFLAHEDLETSEGWRDRILSELCRCDLFVPLLSKNFLGVKVGSAGGGIYCITSRGCYRATLDRRDDSFRIPVTCSEQPHSGQRHNP